MSVIFLNGCTSAGKSSIARMLQDLLDRPFLRTGIDDAFSMLPAGLHNHKDGVFFDSAQAGAVRLRYGAFGLATLHAHIQASAAIARSGVDLILDEVILTAELREAWVKHLVGLDVMLVGVRCQLQELERREIERGDRIIGQARGQYGEVHADMFYDLEIDTTNMTIGDAAISISEAFSLNAHGTALERLSGRES